MLRNHDKDMAQREERYANVNNGFVEANKILQQKRDFEINRNKLIAEEEQKKQEAYLQAES